MTALEIWCLAMIGLVFQSLISYVVILVGLKIQGGGTDEMQVHVQVQAQVQVQVPFK
jgi:hypothetical protein